LYEIEIPPEDLEEFEREGYAHVIVDDYVAFTLVEECTTSS
jgi:hypothetical protein